MTKSSHDNIAHRILAAKSSSNGDRHQLLEGYRNYLTLLAYARRDRILRSKFSDSDLVQETLMQAHRDLPGFRGRTEAELAGWLRAIMSKKQALLARRYYGSPGRDPRLEVQFQDEFNASSQLLGQALVALQRSPSEQAAHREGAVLLADALASLPEHYREVVVMRHIEGLKMREVAKEMGRTVDSVNKLWARAMIQLRSLMRGVE